MSNNKRLERDLSRKVLGGVCSGLGNYFGVDPIFWRILFIILCFVPAGPGVLTYIILWIVMPERKNINGYVQPDTEQSEQPGQSAQPTKSNGSWVAGLIFIGIGTIWLLMRYIPQITWQTVWPVILIAVGIFFLIPTKSK